MARCPCGKLMDRRVQIVSDAASSNVKACIFPNNSYKFIISNDLFVFQSSAVDAVKLFSKIDIKRWNSLESMVVNVTAKKIIELLQRLLVSDTPLTDVFLGRHNEEKHQNFVQPGPRSCNETVGTNTSRKISVKLFLKEDQKVLFAEADREFVDHLVSFLTYPIGSVVDKLGGKSGIRCIDNLYKSIELLKLAKSFNKNFPSNILLKPMLPQHFSLKNKLINIDEQPQAEMYYKCFRDDCDSDEVSTNPKFMCKSCNISTRELLTLANSKYGYKEKEYMRSSMYMITDDLAVKPLSLITVGTDFLRKSGKEIIAKNVEIGEHEALALLQASIISKKVLTVALVVQEGGNRRSRS